MKYLTILLLFCGCSTEPTFTVYDFVSTENNTCEYRICQLGSGPKECFTITDSCGLYQVGDTLKLIKK